jgi:tRNA(fMet)-specific endonuclease VapC
MVLVDTNIVSFEFRRDSRLSGYVRHLAGQEQAISFVTLAELYKWPLERGFSEARSALLEAHVRAYLVLPFDDGLARAWAGMQVTMRRAGTSIGHEDDWIAATALRHDLPLVTHNRRHFERVPGLTLISES